MIRGAGGLSANPLVRLARDYAWRYRWSYLAGAAFLWITNYLSVSIPGEIGRAIDALRGELPVGPHVAAIAAMGIAVIGVRTLSRILIFNPGRHVEYHLRADLFTKLLQLQPEFYARHKRGDIVSRASNDITWVRTLVGYGGLQVFNVTIAVVLTGWKMLTLSPKLTLLALLPILVGMGLVQWSIRRLFHLSRRSQEQLGEISEHVLGSLQGIAAIQGFVAHESFIGRFEERNQDWLRTGMKLAVIRATALPLLVLTGGIAMFVLLAVGGRMVLTGGLTLGELAAFTALLTVLLPPLRSLGWMLSVIQRGRAALERIFGSSSATSSSPTRMTQAPRSSPASMPRFSRARSSACSAAPAAARAPCSGFLHGCTTHRRGPCSSMETTSPRSTSPRGDGVWRWCRSDRSCSRTPSPPMSRSSSIPAATR
jgi:ATP-binding cassette subfamily B protein